MNLFYALFGFLAIFLSNAGLAEHPFCTHALYSAATGEEYKFADSKFSANKSNFLEPFYIAAILQRQLQPDDQKQDYQVLELISDGLHQLAVKAAWLNISKSDRQTLDHNEAFAEQLDELNLDFDAPTHALAFFGLRKIKEILNNPKQSIQEYSYHDLLQVMLEPGIRTRMPAALRQICQRLAPLEVHTKESAKNPAFMKKMQELAQENVENFNQILAVKFEMDNHMTATTFAFEADFSILDRSNDLNQILSNQPFRHNDVNNTIFTITHELKTTFRKAAVEMVKELCELRRKQFNLLINKNKKLISFFQNEKMFVLNEFIDKYSIKSLAVRDSRQHGMRHHLYFADQAELDNMNTIEEMRYFIRQINQQLEEQGLESNFQTFFKIYFQYHKSLELTQEGLDTATKILCDRAICHAVGLSFPCFDNVLVSKMRLSRNSVAALTNSPDELAKRVEAHLEALAGLIMNLEENGRKRIYLGADIDELRHLVLNIKKTFAAELDKTPTEAYLPIYNRLIRKLYQIRAAVLNEIAMNASAHNKTMLAPDLQRYLEDRISHLL